MLDTTKGRYWDRPWSLVSGCTPCSPGCERCWSAAMTKRFKPYVIEGDMAMPLITDDGQRFNGRIITHPERLSIPLKRRKPTVYAVWNDLFHEAVPRKFQRAAILVAASHKQHTFLILTKRPQVMLEVVGNMPAYATIYYGLTVCNQEEADQKIPTFLKVPGKKFLSVEPMLGPIDLRKINDTPLYCLDAICGEQYIKHETNRSIADSFLGIDAVILGGETGAGARPMHPDWVRSVRDQCEASGTPFFFKSWGKDIPDDGFFPKRALSNEELQGFIFESMKSKRFLDGRTHDELAWT